MTNRIESTDGRTFVITDTPTKATHITVDDTLADGAIVLATSHQREWFYVKAIKRGRSVRRRYRHDQIVSVEKWSVAKDA